MAPADVRKAVMALDEFLLPRHVLDQLLKFIPTEEEVSDSTKKAGGRTRGDRHRWPPAERGPGRCVAAAGKGSDAATRRAAVVRAWPRQITLIKEHEHEVEKLGVAERFFYEVCRRC